MELGPASYYASPMTIFWMRTRDAWRDATWTEGDMSAFHDGVVFPRIHSRSDGEPIGMVRPAGAGLHSGQWSWSMTVCLAGPAFGATTNGYASTRGDAGRAMLDRYARYLKSRPRDYTKAQAG